MQEAYAANTTMLVTTPFYTTLMVLLAIYQELQDPRLNTSERQLLLSMARLWYAMAYLQEIPLNQREEVLSGPYGDFKAAIHSYEDSLKATGNQLPNDPDLNELVATALMRVNEVLATGIGISNLEMLLVDFRLNQFVQTLSVDRLARTIVDAMRSVYRKMMVVQGDTNAERKDFLQPELQTFILTLRVIPRVGEFLATAN
jgi:hypothetical protein